MQSSVFLKNLLLSTSSINKIRHEKNKKVRGKYIGNFVGVIILDIILLAYCILTSLGFGMTGLTEAIPVSCAVIISAMEFILCLFRTNGYIFALSDYEMTMSLPLSVKNIVSSRFLYMYIKNLFLVMCISLPMMVSYGIFTKAGILTYLLWIILTFFMPLIPMTAASLLGTVIAAFGARSRHKNLVQTILMFVLVLALFSLRFVMEDIFANDKIQQTMQTLSASMNKVQSAYIPVQWFVKAVTEANFFNALFIIAASLVFFEITFYVISRFYRQIVSRLMVGTASKKYTLKGLEVRSPEVSVAFKELRSMLGSTNYMVNNGLGFILLIILCLFALILGFDKIIAFFTHGAPVKTSILIPAIPMIVFFLVGMTSTTSVSYSMEGKNIWIFQSLPLSLRTFVSGKMLFNLCLTIPFAIFGNVILSLSAHTSFIELLLSSVCGIVQCIYATNAGMIINLLFPKLDWKNDIEVIKQGASVAIYMLPNMFLTMGVGVLAVIAGLKLGSVTAILLVTALYAILAAVAWILIRIKTGSALK